MVGIPLLMTLDEFAVQRFHGETVADTLPYVFVRQGGEFGITDGAGPGHTGRLGHRFVLCFEHVLRGDDHRLADRGGRLCLRRRGDVLDCAGLQCGEKEQG